jgi:hypothetical protein
MHLWFTLPGVPSTWLQPNETASIPALSKSPRIFQCQHICQRDQCSHALHLFEQRRFRIALFTDLASPALLKMLQKTIGGPLVDAGSPLKFAPPREGPEFFAPYGWRSVETRSLLHTAAKLKRLSFGMRLLSLLPDPAGRKPDKPWGGVRVLENCGPARAN